MPNILHFESLKDLFTFFIYLWVVCFLWLYMFNWYCVQKNVKIRDSKFGVALVVETSAMVRHQHMDCMK